MSRPGRSVKRAKASRPRRAEPDVHGVGELRPDTAGGLGRRACPEQAPVEQDDVAGTGFGEMEGAARPDHAAADDDDVGGAGQRGAHRSSAQTGALWVGGGDAGEGEMGVRQVGMWARSGASLRLGRTAIRLVGQHRTASRRCFPRRDDEPTRRRSSCTRRHENCSLAWASTRLCSTRASSTPARPSTGRRSAACAPPTAVTSRVRCAPRPPPSASGAISPRRCAASSCAVSASSCAGTKQRWVSS